ncbi:MAG TPA: polysaccharide biosynthesis tyrosine autokinase [bacterium]|nr:polysaccharide biosynthesis tyrosine autokinase [bacterium]HPG45757.1 polysaccharide biosynthesis tyrosine autokinase [bacterium]HPM98016.1 polysaccharide biosynthesis tyrosine autokinase [bacterium]
MSVSEVDSAREWELRDYLNLLIRRKWLIAVILLLSVLIGAVRQFTRPAIYGSSTVFSIEMNEGSGLGGFNVPSYYYYVMNQGRGLEYYQTIVYSDIYNQQLLSAVEQDSTLKAFGAGSMEAARLAAGGGLSLSMNEETRLLTLSVRAETPVVAYRVADLAAQVFRLRNQQIEMENAQNTVRFIDQQRAEAQATLEATERELLQFKGGTSLSPVVSERGVVNRVVQAEAALEQIEMERRLAETNVATYRRQLQQVDPSGKMINLDAADTPALAGKRAEIARLETQRDEILLHTSRDSVRLQKLERQIAEGKEQLRQQILSAYTGEDGKNSGKSDQLRELINQRLVAEEVSLNSLRSRELYYRNMLNQYRKESPEMLDRDIELTRLQRTQIVNQNLLSYLVERHEEAKIRASASIGGLRTITPAGIPSAPLPNGASRNIMVSLFMGLGLGFGLAMLLEYLDQTVHSRDELERLSGLQVVGQIPQHGQTNASRQPDNNNGKHNGKHNGKIPQRKKRRHKTLDRLLQRLHLREPGAPDWKASDYPLLTRMRADVPFAESYRDLRTNLQFYHIDEPIKKMVITSAIPGEGKTSVTANLALSMTELGKRVVILDADLRKPKINSLFDLERVPGFTDYFMELASYSDIIKPTATANLFVVPAGRIPPNPTEVLNSQKMADFIARLTTEFDFVLVDSPPLLSVTDAKILSHIVEHLLLISRFGHTEKRYISEAATALQQFKVSIVGVVFNGIEFTHAYGKYKYKYHYYYESQPERMGRQSAMN